MSGRFFSLGVAFTLEKGFFACMFLRIFSICMPVRMSARSAVDLESTKTGARSSALDLEPSMLYPRLLIVLLIVLLLEI